MRRKLFVLALVALCLAPALVVPEAGADTPAPTIYLSTQGVLRGDFDIAAVWGEYLEPSTNYVVATDHGVVGPLGRDGQFPVIGSPTSSSMEVTSDAAGVVRVAYELPSNVPLDVTSATITVTPAGATTPVATTQIAAEAPYADDDRSTVCPGASVRVAGYGFADGQYDVAGPFASLAGNPVTAVDGRLFVTDATFDKHLTSTFQISFSAMSGPAFTLHQRFDLSTPSSTDNETQRVPEWFHVQHASCFEPGETVRLTPLDKHTRVPHTVVADRTGRIQVNAGLVPGPTPTTAAGWQAVGLSSGQTFPPYSGSGPCCSWPQKLEGTTLQPGAYLDGVYAGAIITPAFGYELGLSQCSPLLSRVFGSGNSRIIWSHDVPPTFTSCTFAMDRSGDLVLRTRHRTVLWHTGTRGTGNTLSVTGGGQAVVRTPQGIVLWSDVHGTVRAPSLRTGRALTSGHALVRSDAQLRLGTDGNLVAYLDGAARWQSRTAGRGGTRLTMDRSGDLRLTDAAGHLVWHSRTAGSGLANQLRIAADGDVGVYTAAGRRVWHTNSGR